MSTTEQNQIFLTGLMQAIILENQVVAFSKTSWAMKILSELPDWKAGRFDSESCLYALYQYEQGKGKHYQSVIEHFDLSDDKYDFALEVDEHAGSKVQRHLKNILSFVNGFRQRRFCRKATWFERVFCSDLVSHIQTQELEMHRLAKCVSESLTVQMRH